MSALLVVGYDTAADITQAVDRTGTSVALETGAPISGAGSLKIARTSGSVCDTYLWTPLTSFSSVVISASTQYTYRCKCLTATGSRTGALIIDYFNSGGGAISTDSGSNVALTAGTPTLVSATFTSPALAVYARIWFRYQAAGAAEVWYVDDLACNTGNDTTYPELWVPSTAPRHAAMAPLLAS